jgi:hypothetical protein
MSVYKSYVPVVQLRAMLVVFMCTGFALFNVNGQDQERERPRVDKYKAKLREADSLIVERKRNIVKTDLLGFMVGYYNVTFERLARSAPRSILGTIEYADFKYEEFDFRGISFMPALRYYILKKRVPPAGFYVEPFLIYSDYKVFDNNQLISAHIDQLGGGIHGGYQWVIADKITIDCFLGGVYVETSVKGGYVSQGAIRSFQVVAGVNAGFRF